MRVFDKPLRLPLAICLATTAFAAAPVQTVAQTVTRASDVTQLNTGRGRLVTLSAPISDVFVADDKIADVQVRSPTQIYVFGKAPGETTISATTKAGRVVYASTVRVGNNFDSIGSMLQMALPESRIVATPMNGLVLLTGVVATPEDGAEAERLVQAFVGEQTKVLSRLKTATPLQVNLQVRFAEVSRSFVKNIGVNVTAQDTTSGFQFGVSSGRNIGSIGTVDTSSLPRLDASSRFGLPAGSISLPFDPKLGDFVYPNTGTAYNFANLANTPQRTALGFAGKLLGLDILSALDLGEINGQVSTLNTTNLSALSGESSSFLAGGEIPIPISQGLGAVSVEYKQYGVSLAYTPTVMSDGRISLRVRPEVSQLSAAGAVTIGGVQIPALTTRRAETTVELGSGQSFMIAGLLQNRHDNQISKAPGIGDMPILGALFRSNGFQRNETELVIVVTPYLVKPVDANSIVLPTDGYKAPTDADRILLGSLASGDSHGDRPKPQMIAPSAPPPSVGAVTPSPVIPARREEKAPVPAKGKGKDRKGPAAAPGFSFK
ncbi:type II and III secretion system protein family protein [Sphingomonas sp.]|uniref:type II and III secretion system protein family protein n=1 Tax=Sphingomonas sp. TaxID=28214 RepID=UPI002DD63246|nr:type II and III secretion system protein family protein [Sphingomonas sp.]